MFLGVEIGGTKLQLGIGPGDGTLAGLWRGAVVPAEGADGIRRQIEAAVPELLTLANIARDRLHGVGIGFGGPVDDAGRTVIKSHQIGGWDDFPLADWIGDLVGLPAVIGNDADVAGLAEAHFGAGRGADPVFYVTIGSGIGGGLILGGRIHRGTGRGAAEIGHLRVRLPGMTDAVTLESLASGWGIQEHLRANWSLHMSDFPRWHGIPIECITTQEIAREAALGDEYALQALERAQSALAEGLCHVIALICPRRIVLGGGVSMIDDRLWLEPIREKVDRLVFRPFANCCDIVTAELGEAVVLHGALALAAGVTSSSRR
jgi:glucokinase